jgi:N-acetylglucosamine kinase-like BadF-type ATPase
MVFLGIDVGGSKTHALLSDESGQVLGFGVGPGGNPEMVGYDGLTLAMLAALHKACKRSGMKRTQIAAAGFGIAGYDWPFQYAATLQAVQALRLRTEILAIENDAVLPIYGGSMHGWGIAACVGTGNNVRGVDAQGKTGRITGNSSTYGEFGGAVEIMQTVLQRLGCMWTGRGKATALAELLIRDCDATDLGDLIEGLVAERYHLKADQAPLVVQAAESGDAVAGEVLTWHAHELANSVLAVAGQLDLIEQPFEVVMSGRLFQASELYHQAFIGQVVDSAPLADCKKWTAPPVVGAVIMAMQAARAGGAGIAKARAALLGIGFKNNKY